MGGVAPLLLSSRSAFSPHIRPPWSDAFSSPLFSLQLSEDESDLEISSLEDLPQDLNQREKPKPLSRSKLPEKFDASSWSPSQHRVPGW